MLCCDWSAGEVRQPHPSPLSSLLTLNPTQVIATGGADNDMKLFKWKGASLQPEAA